jgi:hypothetical protein
MSVSLTYVRCIVNYILTWDSHRTRDPECEDDGAAAELRTTQARDVAIDYAWIIEQSHKPSAVCAILLT